MKGNPDGGIDGLVGGGRLVLGFEPVLQAIGGSQLQVDADVEDHERQNGDNPVYQEVLPPGTEHDVRLLVVEIGGCVVQAAAAHDGLELEELGNVEAHCNISYVS